MCPLVLLFLVSVCFPDFSSEAANTHQDHEHHGQQFRTSEKFGKHGSCSFHGSRGLPFFPSNTLLDCKDHINTSVVVLSSCVISENARQLMAVASANTRNAITA